MFGVRWRLFRLFGIPIGIDASWLIILALLTWTLINFFTFQVPGHPGGTYAVMGLATALAFFVCIVLHELGHAVVAKRVGIPMRGITLFLFGGVAEMESEPPSARSEFLMAIAGPLVSLVLSVVFFVLGYVGLSSGWSGVYAVPLLYLGWINLVVLLFNMVPAFPLDGGRVLRSILWGTLNNLRKATLWASRCGQVFAWFLIGLGVLQLFAGNLFGGIWLGIIGMFLNNAAQMSYQQVIVRQALQGEPLRRFMNTDPVTVAPDLDLHTWVEDVVYRHHHKTYPVVVDDRLHGVVSINDLSSIPREEWSRRTIEEVMRRDVETISLPPDADALEALEKMNRTGCSRLLVVENQRLVGLISLKDLLRFLDLKLQLHHGDDTGDGPRVGWQQVQRRDDSSLRVPR